jgi:hypothetical protein
MIPFLMTSAAVIASPQLIGQQVSLSPSAQIIANQWNAAIEAVEANPLAPDANLAVRMSRLIELDEVTRANLWRVDNAKLDPTEKRALEIAVGERLRSIDLSNTEALKKLLPADGWFRNSKHGRTITHGAWLIAQHSPDQEFRAFALAKLKQRLASGDVDARDYALMFDRVRLDTQRPQVYGSQAICKNGFLILYPIEQPEAVDRLREEIGWSQTIAETRGDLEIGKPCEL